MFFFFSFFFPPQDDIIAVLVVTLHCIVPLEVRFGRGQNIDLIYYIRFCQAASHQLVGGLWW